MWPLGRAVWVLRKNLQVKSWRTAGAHGLDRAGMAATLFKAILLPLLELAEGWTWHLPPFQGNGAIEHTHPHSLEYYTAENQVRTSSMWDQWGIFKMFWRERSLTERMARADLEGTDRSSWCGVLKLKALDAWREENQVGDGLGGTFPSHNPPLMPSQYISEKLLLLFSCQVVYDSFRSPGLQHARDRGLPVSHHVSEFAQVRVHWTGDTT